MGTKEVDLIADAIAGTEKEIFDAGFDREPAEEAEHDGDRSVEEMGDGLEGQHEAEAEAEEDAEGDESDADHEDDAETERARDPKTGQFTKKDDKEADEPTDKGQPQHRTDDGRVPRTALLSERDRRQAAEAAAEAAKTELTSFRQQATEQFAALNSRLDSLLNNMATRPAPVQQAEPTKPVQVPDLFEDPTGFMRHATKPLTDEIETLKRQNFETRAEMSMRIAAVNHKEVFPQAWDAFQKLNPNDPTQAAHARQIATSPDPGEALVSWHRQQVTLREVGNDPAAYRAKLEADIRAQIANDPEFKKQLLDSMRGEATGATQPNSQPRTRTRLPSLGGMRGGSNANSTDPRTFDNSDRAVFDSAFD